MNNDWKPTEQNIGQPVLKENTKNSNEPSDTEILEFLLNQFQMHSPKMNGQHSWRFMNDYCMKFAVPKFQNTLRVRRKQRNM